jgi:hypothetical protein
MWYITAAMKTNIIRHHHWTRPRRSQARRVRAGCQGRDSQAGIHHQHPREPQGAEPPASGCAHCHGGRHAQPVDQPLSGRSGPPGAGGQPAQGARHLPEQPQVRPQGRRDACPDGPHRREACSIPSSTSARKCSATCCRSSCATTWCASAWTSSARCASPSRAWASACPRRVRNPSPATPAKLRRASIRRPLAMIEPSLCVLDAMTEQIRCLEKSIEEMALEKYPETSSSPRSPEWACSPR